MVDKYEERRLQALRRYGLLDSPPEAIFDGITLAVAHICEVPVALISLVDSDRQWFKSAFGLNVRQTPREVAFCAHAIAKSSELMVVEDASEDARFRDNPLVTDDPDIRFYAGKPLVNQEGYALGTLCVIDRKPRRLKQYQYDALTALGETVAAIFDERQRLERIAVDRDRVEDVVRGRAQWYQHRYEDAEAILHGILQKSPAAAAMTNPSGHIVAINDGWPQFHSRVGWASGDVGTSLLDMCVHETAPFGGKRKEVVEGLREVLSGVRDHYLISYSHASSEYTMIAEPIARQTNAGALIQHQLVERRSPP